MSSWTTIDPGARPQGTQALEQAPTQGPVRWWQALWSRRGGRLHDIRHGMLAHLQTVESGHSREQLTRRIHAAAQPQDLWALRDELRTVLVGTHGELLAHQKVTDISFMFAGLLQTRSERGVQARFGVDHWDDSTPSVGSVEPERGPLRRH